MGPGLRWCRLLVGVLLLSACGGSDPAPGTQPPNTIRIYSGSGPVADAAAARLRVLAHMLGLADTSPICSSS